MADPEADRDGLIFVIAEITLNKDVQMSDVTWDTLPADAHATLKAVMNSGINPSEVRLRLVSYADQRERVDYVIAAHRNEEADFSAYYIVKGTWLVASYEN